MSTAARDKRLTARDKVARQRRAQRRARLFISGGSVVVVLAIVLSLVPAKALGSPRAASPGSATGSALPCTSVHVITFLLFALVIWAGTAPSEHGADLAT